MSDEATFNLTGDGHIRIFDMANSKVWDANAGAMGTLASVTAAHAAVAVPFTTEHRIGSITLPTGLPTGCHYYVAVYNVAATSASSAESPVSVFRVFKDVNVTVFENELVTSWKR
jgi:hypothetical protein